MNGGAKGESSKLAASLRVWIHSVMFPHCRWDVH